MESKVISSQNTRRKVGFIDTQEVEQTAPHVFRTITRNIFDSKANKSTFSVIDRLYIQDQIVGERVLSHSASSYKPMEAREEFLRGNFEKYLKYFKDGDLVKQTKTVVQDGLRTQRKIFSPEDLDTITSYQKEIQELEKALAEPFPEVEMIDKRMDKLNEISTILEYKKRGSTYYFDGFASATANKLKPSLLEKLCKMTEDELIQRRSNIQKRNDVRRKSYENLRQTRRYLFENINTRVESELSTLKKKLQQFINTNVESFDFQGINLATKVDGKTFYI